MSSLPTTLSSPLQGGRAFACWLMLGVLAAGAAHAQDKPVYKCPGNLYTDALSSKEAQSRGCRTLDGAPITVIQSVQRTAPTRSSAAAPSDGERISADKQKSMDTDARRILEAELRKEEEALTGLRQEYNNGQPERRGDEKNYQKYLDRVEQLKAEIARRESNVASLKRELGKFSSASQ
ncbi:hypothetical protein WNB94_02320 [Aquabacterium sp. A3]|uniref:hypothetical protein n=1 Tax=Aquabacterium sp. A3 TaxID=3132829 RepID=UPI0031198337